MTITPEAPIVDTELRDDVIAQLGGYGQDVDCANVPKLSLTGRNALWLVTAGAMDLFAVDSGERGRWHFVGRLEPGSLVLGPIKGPKHTLIGRPLQGCAVRRLRLGELIRSQRDTWVHERTAGGLSPQERALCRGVDAGLQVLLEPTHDGLPPRDFVPLEPGQRVTLTAGQHGRSVSGVVWIDVQDGRLRFGGRGSASDRTPGDLLTINEKDWVSAPDDGEVTAGVRSTAGLLDAGELWQNLLHHQARFMYSLDRYIADLDRTYDQRMRAGQQAGEDIRAKADAALLKVIDAPGPATDPDAGNNEDDATLAVARLVARQSGITVVAPVPGENLDSRQGPIGRISIRSGFRIRVVKLSDGWWRDNVGPLVGYTADDARTPLALLWRRGSYHATDPATGERWRLTAELAARIAPHAVMFYRPLPHQPVGLLRLLAFGLRGNSADARNLVLGGAAAVALGSLVPVATGQVLGVFVPNAESSLIVQVCLGLVATSVLAAVFMLLQNVAILRMEGRLDGTLQAAVWDRLLRLPTPFFASRSTGELASAAMGVSAIRHAISGVSSVAVQAGLVGTVNFLLLLFYSVPLGLAVGGLVVLSAAIFLGLGFRQLRWQRQLIELQNKLNNRAFQTLRGLPKLRVAAAESFAYADWARDFVRSREIERRVGRMQNLVTVFNVGFVPACSAVLFLLLAGPFRGNLSVAGFLTFNVSVTVMLTAMIQLTGAITSAGAVVPLYQQLKPVLNELPEVNEASASPGELSGEIEVNHLTFRYAEDGPLILDDVSFHFLPGEFIAVVGGSGCGKSTLLRLLIGFNEPTSGSVLYDGQDFSGLDRAAVRRQCGVVLQNGQPFTGSIYDCICGAERFSMDAAWEAAEMSGLAGDIAQMPMGMHTVISDGGGTLSGGQRQRLMIAQALIRKPRILFFDEATSALDNETQRIVTESTRKLNATRIVIAHRLSTVMDADRVIVMDAGRIVQQGPPAQLLTNTEGLFYQLVRRQVA